MTDATSLAERVGAAMWNDDRASRHLGMQLVAVGEGTATLSMTVAETMVNGLGICHGGLIFTLADSACAFASNSSNDRAVLQSAHVAMIAPARLGMTLVATAAERHRGERSALYDVRVRDAATDATIAEFRGQVRKIAGTVIPSP